jgi:hypothetical protein
MYDSQGRAKAFGAETEDDEVQYIAEEQNWTKCER